MNDFYVTLPSHSSRTEFPNNASNSFKIRLPHPIRLEGGEWKVGLVAVLLLDPINQLPNIMKDDTNILFRAQWLATDTTASSNTHHPSTAVFQMMDLTRVGNLDVLDGTDLLNDMKTFFNKKKVENSLRKGWKLAEADGENHTSVHFTHEGDDFILHNHDVKLTKHGGTYYPSFHINAELTVAMGWFVDKGSNVYELGPNLILEIPDGAIPDPIDLPNPSDTKF